jgi:hypothetical protein
MSNDAIPPSIGSPRIRLSWPRSGSSVSAIEPVRQAAAVDHDPELGPPGDGVRGVERRHDEHVELQVVEVELDEAAARLDPLLLEDRAQAQRAAVLRRPLGEDAREVQVVDHALEAGHVDRRQVVRLGGRAAEVGQALVLGDEHGAGPGEDRDLELGLHDQQDVGERRRAGRRQVRVRDLDHGVLPARRCPGPRRGSPWGVGRPNRRRRPREPLRPQRRLPAAVLPGVGGFTRRRPG